MDKTKKYIIISLALLIAFISVGYFSYKKGFNTANEKVKTYTSYITLPTLRDSIPNLSYSEVSIPNPSFITKTDTIYKDSLIYTREVIDTARILEDWTRKRLYAFNVFNNDTIGKLDVSWNTQYNKSSDFTYSFVPIAKVVQKKTDRSPRRFHIFGGIGTDNAYAAGGLYDINTISIGAQYMNTNKQNHYMLLVGISF